MTPEKRASKKCSIRKSKLYFYFTCMGQLATNRGLTRTCVSWKNMSSVCLRSWNSPSDNDEYTYIKERQQLTQEAKTRPYKNWRGYYYQLIDTSMIFLCASSTWFTTTGVSFTNSLMASMWLYEMSSKSFGRGQRKTWYLNAMIISS